ncbi:sensor histidine kinase [Streptomyces lavendulae]|uniref:sensor histidine kinase n=1 Tax=Streptomyces lavendulae TaxID=1914 RepID=UPI003818C833
MRIPRPSPRLVDGALCAVATVTSLLALEQDHRSGLFPTYTASVLFAVMAAGSLLLRRTAPEFVMVMALASTLTSADPTLLMFAAYALGAYGEPDRWAGAATPLMVAGAGLVYVATRDWADPAHPGPSGIAYEAIVTLCFPAVVGDLMRRRRQLTGLLRRRLVVAEEAVDRAAEQAVVEERTRLAFDIHDGVGYQATVLRLHAEALSGTAGMPESAAALAATVGEAASGVQRDLRRLLDVLRGEGDPSSRSGPAYARFVASLVRNLRAAGVDVSHRRTGRAYPLPDAVDEVLRNCGREALTNAVKHGNGAPVVLLLDFRPGAVTLEVSHGPGGMANGVKGAGIGLASMRERVARVGGRMSAGATAGGGFLLRVELPVPDGAGEAADAGRREAGRSPA